MKTRTVQLGDASKAARSAEVKAAQSFRLPDVVWFQEGPGVRKWQFTSSGIKLLNVGNILLSGELDLSKTERHLSKEEVEIRYKHFLVDDGDLVIASSGISFDEDRLLRTRGAFVQRSHHGFAGSCVLSAGFRVGNRQQDRERPAECVLGSSGRLMRLI